MAHSVVMPPPNDAELERALRDVVTALVNAGDFDNLTVKRVRAVAEQRLDLDPHFFRNHRQWKAKSKELISTEAERQQTSQKTASSPASAPSGLPVRPTHHETRRRKAKRDPPLEAEKSRKRQKRVTGSESDLELSESHSRSASVRTGTVESASNGLGPEVAKERSAISNNHDDSSELSDHSPALANHKSEERSGAAVGDDAKSESELSVLLDEAPPPKKKGRNRPPSDAQSKPGSRAAKATKAKNGTDTDPQKEEIKRLQGWLVKCGIRKLWSKELAPYETGKAKILHLINLLKDAGMEGRFSLDRARQIKDERELKADLEAVQEGAKRWGQSDGETRDDDGAQIKSKRRLAKGFKDLDFLGNSDGEDSG